MKVYLLALAVFATAASFAQDKAGDKKKAGGNSLSVGVEAGLPVGKDLKDGYNFGIGGSVKAGINVFDGGDVTISAGYVSFMAKTIGGVKGKALGTVPLKAGLRFRISEGFYGEPQLGYTIAKVSGEDGNANGFTYAANLGYLINNQIDVAVRYEAWSKSENGVSINPSFVGLRLAYQFPL